MYQKSRNVAAFLRFSCRTAPRGCGTKPPRLGQLACGKQLKFALSPIGAPFCLHKTAKLGPYMSS